MSAAEILANLPFSTFSYITYDENEYTVFSHYHSLTRISPHRNTGWKCDRIKGATHCLSGIDAYNISENVQRF